jgi:hypothetical protein
VAGRVLAAELLPLLAVDLGELQVEAEGHLLDPLVGEGGWAGHQHPGRSPAPGQLEQDQAGLDGLAQANVVGDEQPRPRQPERLQHRDELVGLQLDPPVLQRHQVATTVGHGQAERVVELLEPDRVADAEPKRLGRRDRQAGLQRGATVRVRAGPVPSEIRRSSSSGPPELERTSVISQ